MGRQSSRIFFQGKDHKEIFFRGHYHKAAYIGNILVWEKLVDFIGKYWAYTRTVTTNFHYSNAILDSKDEVREYWELENIFPSGLLSMKDYFSRNDKYFIYMGRNIDTNFCRGFLISKNAVNWNTVYIDTSALGRYVYNIVPKWDGIVVASNLNPLNEFTAGNLYEYKYCPIKDGQIYQENAVLLYSDLPTAPTPLTIERTINFTDILILFNIYDYSAFAVDIEGNVYDNLFSVQSISNTCYHGCLNGMYWILDYGDTRTDDISEWYMYKTRNPYSPWSREKVFTISARTVSLTAIQAEEYVVLYILYSRKKEIGENQYINEYTLDIYTTTDFETYKKVASPDSLLIPIIGERYTEELKYVKCMLNGYEFDYGRTDSYFINHLQFDIYFKNMNNGRIAYVDNQKVVPFNGIMFQLDGNFVPTYVGSEITVYIDNLFFEQSEGNFAICEQLYPNEVIING